MNLDFTGHWRANLASSTLISPTPAEMTIFIEHSGAQLREEISATRQDGVVDCIVFSCATNGIDGSGLLNGQPLRVKAGWVGEELIIESWMKFGDRELHFRDCWSLTDNRQSLVMEHRDDALAGQRVLLERVEQGRRVTVGADE